jgi:Sec-independent protein translocase protein TatA
MNILGIGPAELVLVFLLMLMVAGPKRMISWAYVAGQYVARFRKMWQEASAVLRKELEQAGLEPEVMDTFEQWANPRTRPKSRNLLDPVVKEMKKPLDDVFKPVSDTMDEIGRTQLTPAAPPANDKPASSPNTEASSASSDGANSSGANAEQASSGGFDAWTPN